MEVSHHVALLIGYGTALAAWLLVARVFPGLWPRQDAVAFAHPWREVGWALLAVLCVIGIGQLYVRNWRLPTSGPWGPLLEAVNQLLIFSPILALPFLRGHGLRTAWIPTNRLWARLPIGLALAALAIAAFTLVRQDSDSWLEVYPRVYQPKNLGYLVQVFCEDVAIAVLFVRFRAAIGLYGTIVFVACLFAAAHIPTMVAKGTSLEELARLLLDAGLGVGVLLVAQRSADVWWLWSVHYAMDMMQLYAATPETARPFLN
ncbi:MAG: hypothetical protein L0215_27350 [Gemmataceae bacterium]|nr:hypothetical protein [Gemmataceae bacterium]